MKRKLTYSTILKNAKALNGTPYLMEYLWARTAGANKSYKMKDGYSRPMKKIILKITNLCDLRCKMCPQWGETGYSHEMEKRALREMLPLQRYKELIDEVAPHKPLIYITGGEPFLYPDILELMRYIKEKNLLMVINTNGSKLEKYAKELVENGPSAIIVSIDGPPEMHNHIRNSDQSFQNIEAGLKRLSAIKKEKNHGQPLVVVNHVVTKDNSELLEKTYDSISCLNVDFMSTFLAWKISKKMGEKHAEIVEKELGTTPYIWQSYVGHDGDTPDMEKFILQKQKLEKKSGIPLVFSPELPDKKLSKFYSDLTETFGHKKCTAPWFECIIMPDGEVMTCTDFWDISVGNISNQPVLDVWNGEKFRKFRMMVKNQGGLLPICSRCCGLLGM